MAKTTDNDELIPKGTREAILEVDASLEKLDKRLEETLAAAQEIFKVLSKISGSRKEVADAIDKQSEAEKAHIALEKESGRLEQEKYRLKAKLALQNSQQAKDATALRLAIQEQNKANKDAVKFATVEKNNLDALAATVARLTKERRKLTIGSKEYIEATNKLAEANARLSKEEKAGGSFGRNVGNYLSKLGTSLSVFAGNMLTKAVSGIGQLVSKSAEFVKVGIDMAAKAEGVTTAFAKLNTPGLLDNLREATKGTVSDLLLMQSAVKAENFGIPLNNLGSLLQFARQRAQETGESIDYLTNSIINGIGRKSPLILDNLGISAVRLREQVAKTGDFTQAAIAIVNEELAEQGDLALTAADKAAQASVKWENAQLKMGQRFKWLGDVWSSISGSIADSVANLAGDTRSATQTYDDQLKKVVDLERNTLPLVERYEELAGKTELTAEEQVELNKTMNSLSQAVPGIVTEFDKYGNILSINTDKVKEFVEAQKTLLSWTHREEIEDEKESIEKLSQRLGELTEQYKAGGRTITEATGMFRRGEKFSAFTPEYMANLDKEIKEVGEMLRGAQMQLSRLNGTTAEEQAESLKKMEDQRAIFNGMTEEQLTHWIDMHKDVVHEYKQLAGQVFSQRFGGGYDDGEDPEKARRKAEQAAKKAEQEAKRRAAEESKAVRDLSELIIKVEAETNKTIVMDQKKSYEERGQALNEYVHSQLDLIEMQAENQKSAIIESLTQQGMTEQQARIEAANQLILIEAKKQAEIQKIVAEGNKTVEELNKQHAEKLIKDAETQATAEAQAINENESNRLVELAQLYAAGKITAREYEAGKTEIAKQFAMERFDAELQGLEKILALSEDKEAVERKIGEARIKYQQYVNDTIVSAEEKAAKQREEIEKKLAEQRKKLLSEVIEFAAALYAGFAQKQLKNLDEESEANKEHSDKEKERISDLEEFGAITKEEADARKAAIDAKAVDRENQLEAERADIQRRQAIFEQGMAIARIGIQAAQAIAGITAATAIAVAAAMAASPLTGGLPWTAVITALAIKQKTGVLISAGVQAAAVLAAGIPNYAEGTGKEGHGGGLAIVGDGGRHEMVITPDGAVYRTPKVDTLMNLPAESVVLPDWNQALAALTWPTMPREEKNPVISIDLDKLLRQDRENHKVLAQISRDQKQLNFNLLYKNNRVIPNKKR